jgi:hypothetical protein
MVTVADSARIVVVTNHRTFPEVPVRMVPEEPEREISDDALYGVAAIQPLPGERVAVGMNGSTSVSIYDARGGVLWRLGREGDGPGEFRYIENLVPLPGDSIGVYDPQYRRLTAFPLDGGTPSVFSFAGVAPALTWSRVHALESGLAYVGRAGVVGGDQTGVYRNLAPSYRIDLEGRVLATYGEFPGMQAFAANGRRNRALLGALLFTAATGDQFVVGTGEHPEFRTYGPDGSLTRIVRWRSADRTVTQEMTDEFVEFMANQGPPEQSDAIRERYAEMLVAPELPTHAEVLASPGGTIWVGEYPGMKAEHPSGRRLSPRSWVVFGSDGTMRERIETPRGFLPMALTEDVVWGVYHDELDVESVRAYRIAQ